MEKSRVVREIKEYEDGTVEERIIRRVEEEEEKRDYESPKTSPLMMLGMLAIGGLAVYMLWKHRFQVMATLGFAPAVAETPTEEEEQTPPGGYANPPTEYASYAAITPRPMVSVDEFVAPVTRAGRWIG